MDKISQIEDASPKIEGIGSAYEHHVRSISLAYLAMAEALARLADVPGSERAAADAWEVARVRSMSPIWTAEQNIACFEFLRHSYEQRGALGKTWIASLYVDLSHDYLASDRAKGTARRMTGGAGGRELLDQCNGVIAEANHVSSRRVGPPSPPC
jgi:hypothetical protein